MSGAWPPPPDLGSIQELVAGADVEGLIAAGAPGDEYEPEGEAIYEKIREWETGELVLVKLLPVLKSLWAESFDADARTIDLRQPALVSLAEQIERFFGPQAAPQTR